MYDGKLYCDNIEASGKINAGLESKFGGLTAEYEGFSFSTSYLNNPNSATKVRGKLINAIDEKPFLEISTYPTDNASSPMQSIIGKREQKISSDYDNTIDYPISFQFIQNPTKYEWWFPYVMSTIKSPNGYSGWILENFGVIANGAFISLENIAIAALNNSPNAVNTNETI